MRRRLLPLLMTSALVAPAQALAQSSDDDLLCVEPLMYSPDDAWRYPEGDPDGYWYNAALNGCVGDYIQKYGPDDYIWCVVDPQAETYMITPDSDECLEHGDNCRLYWHWENDCDPCFLTTAVTRYFGGYDDGSELMTLRRFRDRFLWPSLELRPHVEKYYEIAPEIVTRIDRSPHRDLIYRVMLRDYIWPAMRAIRDGENVKAYAIYRQLVEDLAPVTRSV